MRTFSRSTAELTFRDRAHSAQGPGHRRPAEWPAGGDRCLTEREAGSTAPRASDEREAGSTPALDRQVGAMSSAALPAPSGWVRQARPRCRPTGGAQGGGRRLCAAGPPLVQRRGGQRLKRDGCGRGRRGRFPSSGSEDRNLLDDRIATPGGARRGHAEGLGSGADAAMAAGPRLHRTRSGVTAVDAMRPADEASRAAALAERQRAHGKRSDQIYRFLVSRGFPTESHAEAALADRALNDETAGRPGAPAKTAISAAARRAEAVFAGAPK